MVDPAVLKRNTGAGKVFSAGPICNFKGVDIPTLVCHSKSGGITAEILRGVLQHNSLSRLFVFFGIILHCD